MDTGQAFEAFLPSDKVVINDDLANEFIRTEHVGGLIILDANGDVTAQADMDEQDSYALWNDIIERPVVQDIMVHRDKTYSDVIDRDGVTYNFVAMAHADGIIVLSESLKKPQLAR